MVLCMRTSLLPTNYEVDHSLGIFPSVLCLYFCCVHCELPESNWLWKHFIFSSEKKKKMVCGSSSQRMLGVCFRRPGLLLLVGYLTTAPQKVKGGSPKLSVSLRN